MLRNIITLALVVFGTVSVLAADETASVDQIQQWITQLDSNKFADREHATAKLIGAGHAAAIQTVAQTVENGGPEARTRATHILAIWYRSSDTTARQVVQATAVRWQASKDPRMARLGKAIVTRPAPTVHHRLYQTQGIWTIGAGRPIFFGGAMPAVAVPVHAAPAASSIRLRLR